MKIYLAKFIYLAVLLAMLSCVDGCAVYTGVPNLLGVNNLPPEAIENTQKRFIGVPFVTPMLEKSSARLNSEWIITTRHLAVIHHFGRSESDIIEHPDCDVALIRSKGDNVVPIGNAPIGSTIYHAGYPSTPLGPLPMAVNEGTYIGTSEPITSPFQRPMKCNVGISSASNASGMSGGGVYDPAGSLGWHYYRN